jgi:hypothetical protein
MFGICRHAFLFTRSANFASALRMQCLKQLARGHSGVCVLVPPAPRGIAIRIALDPKLPIPGRKHTRQEMGRQNCPPQFTSVRGFRRVFD